MNYDITGVLDASVYKTIEAETFEDAVDKFYDKGFRGLCHQCSQDMEIGDVVGTIVNNDKGDVLYDDTPISTLYEDNAKLHEEIANLKKTIKVLQGVY